MDPLGAIIPWIATGGLAAVMAAAFVERIVPLLPSYALFVVIGIMAAEGHVSFASAIVFSTGGSILGCMLFYAIGTHISAKGFETYLGKIVQILGLSSLRYAIWQDRFRNHEHIIAFGAQMVPTIRLLGPLMSGLLRTPFWKFLAATGLGATIWNTLFVVIGYAATIGTDGANASALAFKVIVAVITLELAFLLIWQARSAARSPRINASR